MWKGQIAMKISNFIELCESKGYPCQVNKGKLEVFRFYGEDLSDHIRIANISLAAPNQFEMKLDTASASDGMGEFIWVNWENEFLVRGNRIVVARNQRERNKKKCCKVIG